MDFATLPIDTDQPEKWMGYGTENGTLEKVYFEGDSPDDVRRKSRSGAYSVNLHSIWRVKE